MKRDVPSKPKPQIPSETVKPHSMKKMYSKNLNNAKITLIVVAVFKFMGAIAPHENCPWNNFPNTEAHRM